MHSSNRHKNKTGLPKKEHTWVVILERLDDSEDIKHTNGHIKEEQCYEAAFDGVAVEVDKDESRHRRGLVAVAKKADQSKWDLGLQMWGSWRRSGRAVAGQVWTEDDTSRCEGLLVSSSKDSYLNVENTSSQTRRNEAFNDCQSSKGTKKVT